MRANLIDKYAPYDEDPAQTPEQNIEHLNAHMFDKQAPPASEFAEIANSAAKIAKNEQIIPCPNGVLSSSDQI